MMRPERMKKIRVIYPKEYTEKIIEKMYALKIVHIEKHKGLLEQGTPIEKAEEYSQLQLITKWLYNALKITDKKESSTVQLPLSKIKTQLFTLQEEVETLQEKKKTIDEQKDVAEQKRIVLEKISSANIDMRYYQESKYLAIFAGHVESTNGLKQEYKHPLSLQTEEQQQKETFIVAVVEKEYQEAFKKLLSERKYSPLSLEVVSEEQGVPREILVRINKETSMLQKKTQEIMSQLAEKRKQHETFLRQTHTFLAEAIEKAETPLLFGESKRISMITGWIPKSNAEKIKTQLQNIATSGEIDITLSDPDHNDEIPIKLNNPKGVRSFESILKMFSLPSYNEIDPTIILALTFPLFFGFILGDIGYGIVALSLFIFLKKKVKSAASIINVMILSATSSIIFGILFGEVFGTEVVFGYHLPHIISRAHQITDLLYIAVGIGFFHINLGILLGFINEKMSHGWIAALFAKASWMLIELGVVALILGEQIGLPSFTGYIIIGAGIIALLKGEGINGLLELPALFGNMLSYTRLMAVGVASVSLAVVINDLSGMLFTSGNIILVIMGVITLIVGHAINITLGIFEGFVHPLRLHYVEFFTKFFKGSSTEYKPFGVKTT